MEEGSGGRRRKTEIFIHQCLGSCGLLFLLPKYCFEFCTLGNAETKVTLVVMMV